MTAVYNRVVLYTLPAAVRGERFFERLVTSTGGKVVLSPRTTVASRFELQLLVVAHTHGPTFFSCIVEESESTGTSV